MACFKRIEKNEDCNLMGGVYLGYSIPNQFILTVAIDANGHFTGMEFDGTPEITKFDTFEDDDSARFDQQQSEPGAPITQEAYLKWNKLTKEKIEAANEASGCCKGSTWIWFMNDGSVQVQGLDYNKGLSKWSFAKKKAQVSTNAMSNTSADKSHLDYTITSVATRKIAADETIITEEVVDGWMA